MFGAQGDIIPRLAIGKPLIFLVKNSQQAGYFSLGKAIANGYRKGGNKYWNLYPQSPPPHEITFFSVSYPWGRSLYLRIDLHLVKSLVLDTMQYTFQIKVNLIQFWDSFGKLGTLE